MKPTDRNKQLYRDMTEEPEKYSDQEIEAMMDEIDQMPDVEEAWHLLSEKLRVKNQRSLALYTLHSSFKKVAAILIGIIFICHRDKVKVGRTAFVIIPENHVNPGADYGQTVNPRLLVKTGYAG